MVLHGRIENGIVVFPQGTTLPDGTEVTVFVQPSQILDKGKSQRVRLPLISSKAPGSRQLTADHIAEILNEDDLSS